MQILFSTEHFEHLKHVGTPSFLIWSNDEQIDLKSDPSYFICILTFPSLLTDQAISWLELRGFMFNERILFVFCSPNDKIHYQRLCFAKLSQARHLKTHTTAAFLLFFVVVKHIRNNVLFLVFFFCRNRVIY